MKKSKKRVRPITEKQRAADEELREKLRNADLKTLDKALQKAIGPVRA